MRNDNDSNDDGDSEFYSGDDDGGGCNYDVVLYNWTIQNCSVRFRIDWMYYKRWHTKRFLNSTVLSVEVDSVLGW